MIYCDTSFLVSLYVERDVRHAAAARAASRFTEAIPYVALAELQLTNSVRRLHVGRVIAQGELVSLLAQVERDVREGFLVRQALHQGTQYKLALEMSERHMALNARSLDILHVAAARALEAEGFASFDTRQRALAKAEGLALLPLRL